MRFAVGVQPLQAGVQGQLRQDVQVRPVRVGGVNFADEGHAAQHVPLGIPAVRPAVGRRLG